MHIFRFIGRHNFLIVFSVVLLYFFATFSLYSLNLIRMQDTIIYQGSVYQIPVYASFDASDIQSISVVFEYNSKGLDIKRVTGGGNYIYQCPEAIIDKKFDDLEKAKLSALCFDIDRTKDVLFVLNVEGLVSADSVFAIFPKELWINGSKVQDFQGDSATIIVRGAIIYPIYTDELGLNYPNPFSGGTNFPFTLLNATKIKFKIYSFSGDLVYESPENANDVFKIYDINENTEVQDFTKVFSKGRYILEYRPEAMISGGVYFLVFMTDKGVYHKKFLFLK